MHAHILTNLDDLEVGSLNIPVPPASSHIIDPQDLDLIIVPCLTCSRDGCRLGYGGGYYDRYLSAASRATKVILCRHDLLCDELPLEEHDVPVDIVITEQEIID